MEELAKKKRKLLWLGHPDRSIPIQGVFAVLGERFDFTLTLLDEQARQRLDKIIPIDSLRGYDVIVFDLPFRQLYSQASFLQQIKNAVFYEEDACQNFIPASRWYKKFSRFYRRLNSPWVISTGHAVSAKLHAEGINTFCVSKGYAEQDIFPLDQQRTIPLVFIGRTRSRVYKQRQNMLAEVSKTLDLSIMRTTNFAEYVELLQRIGIFFSADIGLGEYMAKNFEAMGAGCLLVAFRQQQGEEDALGLVDGKNVLLYDTAAEAIVKCQWALANPELAAEIALAGQCHAQRYFTHTAIGEKIADVLERIPPPELVAKPSLLVRIKKLFR